MEYFLITQEKEYVNPPIISNAFKQMNNRHNNMRDYDKIDDNTVFLLKNKGDIDYLDWIDRQILLISHDIKDVLKFYMPYMKFKKALMHNPYNKNGKLYYIPYMKIVSCLSEKAEWNFNKSKLSKIVLNEENIPDIPIFQLLCEESRYIIGRLDLVESLLRRNVEGLNFMKIQTD